MGPLCFSDNNVFTASLIKGVLAENSFWREQHFRNEEILMIDYEYHGIERKEKIKGKKVKFSYHHQKKHFNLRIL